MTVFTELAPAKVNLTLEVLGKRPDGYHEIASLAAFARDAADHVTLDSLRPVAVEVSGPFGGSISGKNLIEVTLRRLADIEPRLRLGAVHLEKNLPVAAGIGGGSADAAAVLRAVRRANLELAPTLDWSRLAGTLGADVAVCLENRASWMTGTGDHIQAVVTLPPLFAVLVNPLQPMPADKTARVFLALNAGPVTTATARPPPQPFATAADLIAFMILHGNALDAAARHVAPIIADVKEAIEAAPGCLHAAVSGGGPTCFGIFADHEAAAAVIKRGHPGWWVQPVVVG